MPDTSDASPKQVAQPKETLNDDVYKEIASYISMAAAVIKDTSLSSVFSSSPKEWPDIYSGNNGKSGNAPRQITEMQNEVNSGGQTTQPVRDGRAGSPGDKVILPVEGVISKTPVADPSQVADKLIGEKELGKDAFEKVQSLLKEKGPQAAQDYVKQINDALKEKDSKLQLEMKEESFAGRGPIGMKRGWPAVDKTELKLVDQSKPKDKDADPGEQPSWLLKRTESEWGPIEKDNSKNEFPAYEKFETPKQKQERRVEAEATELLKKLTETKDLKSIAEQLEKSENFEDVVKKINEKLQPNGSIKADKIEEPKIDLEQLIGKYRFGNNYTVTMKMAGQPDQSIGVDKRYRWSPRDEYHFYNSGS